MRARPCLGLYQPERDLLERTLAESLLDVLEEIKPDADLAEITARADRLVKAAALVQVEPDFWQVQNRILSVYGELTDSQVMSPPLHEAFEKLAAGLKVDRACSDGGPRRNEPEPQSGAGAGDRLGF